MEDGTLEKAGDRWQMRFERRLPYPVETVWRAISEPEHLAAWFPTTIEGERDAGAGLHFSFRNGEAPSFAGEMITCEPNVVLEFTWGPDDRLRFELHPEGDGTLLIFTDLFTPLGKAARDSAGWHSCLDRLACELAGEQPSWSPRERWQEVHARYVERFGPEAATLGPPAGA